MKSPPATTSVPGPRTFVVRDPVHGYVRIAPHERIIVDHPITQRLRNISQTGLVHLVYPEARTSRFAHSLGAMHLASRFLVSSIEHAAAPTLKRFFTAIESYVARSSGYAFRAEADLDLSGAHRFGGGALLGPRARVGADLSPEDERQRRAHLTFAEASLRLAALFHDLGHLPFSHDFETALRRYVDDNRDTVPPAIKSLLAEAPHEEIGHRLAALAFETLLVGVSPAVRATYGLAKDILEAQPPYYAGRRQNAGVLAWLHSLVDGEIDCDRADYLLRDGRALGLDFASYDVDRLVDNLVLVRAPRIGFVSAINEPGLSAVESFFLSRARSNQAMIRHHKVSEVAAALQYATVAALGTPPGTALFASLQQLTGKLDGHAAAQFLEQYSTYDDAWWINALRATPPGDDALLNASLQSVLTRQQTLRSLWKRKGDLTPSQVAQLNALAKPANTGARAALTNALRSNGVLLLVHSFTPYRRWVDSDASESILQVVTDSGTLIPAAKHSQLMQSLNAAWDSDLHVFAFSMKQGSALSAERNQLFRMVRASLPSPEGGSPRRVGQDAAHGRPAALRPSSRPRRSPPRER
jgi:HD superfamily phosphohydrolase